MNPIAADQPIDQNADTVLALEEVASNTFSNIESLKNEIKTKKTAFDIALNGHEEYKTAMAEYKIAQNKKKVAKGHAMLEPTISRLSDELDALRQEKKDKQLSLSDYILEHERMTGKQMQIDFGDDQLLVVKTAKLVKPKKSKRSYKS